MRLIDADAMLMRINHEGMESYMDGVCYGVHPSSEYLDLLGEIIDAAPTIDAVPVMHGEWLRGDEMPDYPRVPYKPWMRYCSECREMTGQDDNALYEYCPCCGAKMDGHRKDGDNDG